MNKSRIEKEFLTHFEGIGYYKTYHEGDKIFDEIESNKKIFLLIEGTIAFILNNKHKETVLFELNDKEIQIINGHSILTKDTYKYECKALEESQVLCVLKEEFMVLMQDNMFIHGLVHKNFEKVYTLNLEWLTNYIAMPTTERIYNTLKRIAEKKETKEIKIPVKELMLSLGLSKSMIHKALNELEKDGKLEKKTNMITLK